MKKKLIPVAGFTLLGMVLAFVFAFLLPVISEGGGGTCCPGVGICYPDGGQPPVEYHWWRTDGKPCDAPIE